MDIVNVVDKLGTLGIFTPVKVMGEWYQIKCPIHSNGQEKKPSCGVTLHGYSRGGRYYDAGFCHCFHKNTEVITIDGIKKISDLIEQDYVYVLNGNGDWEKTSFKCYGNDRLWKLVLSRDRQYMEIYTTKNHEWFIKRGKPKRTFELKSGQYLESLIKDSVSFNVDIEGIIHGIIYGDGTRTMQYKYCGKPDKRVDRSDIVGIRYNLKIPKFTKKSNLIQFFKSDSRWGIGNCTIHENQYYSLYSKRFPKEHNFKELPSINCSRDYILSFLAGYFACDGSIDLMCIHSSRTEDLLKIRDLFVRCGISISMFNTIQHDTNYLKNATLSKLSIYTKSVPDEFYILDKPQNKEYNRARWKVVSVEPTDIFDDVYCCETSTKSFVLNGNILTHNCFSCGLASPIQNVVVKVLQERHISSDPKKWIQENIPELDIDEDLEVDKLIPNDLAETLTNQYLDNSYALNYIAQKSNVYVSEEELKSYRYVVPYMKERKLTDEVIVKYDVGFDANFIPPGKNKPTPCITFPVRDISGNTLFFCRRSIEGKMYNYPEGVTKPLYGIDMIPDNCKTLYIAESCINALTLVGWGYTAVALLGTGNTYQMSQLKQLGMREYIICTDGDDAGRKSANKLKKELKSIGLVWTVPMPDGKDVNDLTKEEFESILARRE